MTETIFIHFDQISDVKLNLAGIGSFTGLQINQKKTPPIYIVDAAFTC